MVSIVIPTYSRPERLRRCVASVLVAAKACSEPVEVIVCASGDKGDALDALARMGIRVLTAVRRLLVSAARNMGAWVANGDYLLFIDDDNEVAPDSIYQLHRCLQALPDVAIAGPVT